jgi:hypothetical protein
MVNGGKYFLRKNTISFLKTQLIGTVECHSYNVLVWVGVLYDRHAVDTDVSAEPASIFSVKSPIGNENTDEICRVHFQDPLPRLRRTYYKPREVSDTVTSERNCILEMFNRTVG